MSAPTAGPDPGAARLSGWTVLLSLIGLYFVVSLKLQPWDIPFGLGFCEVFCLAIPVALAVRAQGLDPVSFLGLRAPRPAQLATAALVAAVGYGFAGALNSLNNALFDRETLEAYNPARLFHGTPAQLAILVFSVVVLAPLGEEMLFRGYALRILAARHGPRFGVLATAAIFAAMHLNQTSILALFGLGLIYGVLRLQSGSLWDSLLAHAIENGVSSALVLAGVADTSADVLPVPTALLLLVLTGPLLFFALRLHGAVSRPQSDPVPEYRLPDPSRVAPLVVAWLAVAGLVLGGYALAMH